MTTPKNIEKLKPNQIFVFGSNLNGNHIGGSAKQALDNFGAIEGQGEGLQGQSYAFPTLDEKMEKVSKKALISSKEKLYKCAEENPDCEYKKIAEAEKPNCLYFEINKWVDFQDMTSEEKEKYPSSKTTGGYLKTLEYKEAFTESMQKASKEEIELIKKLPNFDADIFEKISGFRIK